MNVAAALIDAGAVLVPRDKRSPRDEAPDDLSANLDRAFVGDSVMSTGRGARVGDRGAGIDSGSAGSNPSVALRELQARIDSSMANFTAGELLAGISLSPDQESSARAVILKTVQETRVPMPTPSLMMIPSFLRTNPGTGVVSMRAESAATLVGLVAGDADREKLRTRIMSIP